MMLGHALTSGALFFGLGVLYDRYKTRLLFYYGGLILTMPLFSIIYFFFVLSNFAFPGSVNFAAEFLILLGAFELSNVMLFFSSLALILTLIYSLMFYNRIFMGFLPLSFIRFYSDLIRIEA
jgi:NADH-ubiquinone oxidoreductase chain 4